MSAIGVGSGRTAGTGDRARATCPIATSLDIFGDRWTLVVVRDMLVGKRRFGEFLTSRERIATNVLADRLALLERAGIARKRAYQQNPPRFAYELTEKGRGLLPTLQALCRWAGAHLSGVMEPPMGFMDLTESSVATAAPPPRTKAPAARRRLTSKRVTPQ